MKNIKVYRDEDETVSINLGKIGCPECGSDADYIRRRGKGFITHFSQCHSCGKNIQLDKNIYNLFQVGDRIRYYEVLSFGKNETIDYTTYIEGIIISKEKFICSYLLDTKIEKAVFKNKKYPRTADIYNQIYKGINSTSNLIELLTPQMKLII